VSGPSAAGTPVVRNACGQRARKLAALASAHFEDRDALGNQDVRRERRQLIYLASFEGSRVDSVDDPMSCADDSDLHGDSGS
jgi:hypothetical protein